jgi:type I restriction enzyme M protein
MLDNDIVEAIIQLPTDEFFNTGIYTYLWVLNKNKEPRHKNKVMLINASEKFKALKKNKGAKRKEIDEASRQEIVATLTAYQDNAYARVFDKEFFYFNKQAILLTNVDIHGNSFAAQLHTDKSSEKLTPIKLCNGAQELTAFNITTFDPAQYASLTDYFAQAINPLITSLDYKEQPLVITTSAGRYFYDPEQETLIKESNGQQSALGCGKIVVKAALKNASKTQPARIEISVELTPDTQKDYEIIPFQADAAANQAAIAAFMARYISKPFVYLENVVGVEINFNKVFYKPEKLRGVSEILDEIATLDEELQALEAELAL